MKQVQKKRVMALAVAVIAAASVPLTALDPSPLVLLRGCDFSTLPEGMPQLEIDGLQRFESFKVTPSEDYHSGRRNDVLYVNQDTTRLVFEYRATNTEQKSLDVAWLLNHTFIVPSFTNARAHVLDDGFVRLPLERDGSIRLELSVVGAREGLNDLHIVLDSQQPELLPGPSDVTALARGHLIHMNIVRGRYGEQPTVTPARPNVERAIPADSPITELSALAKGGNLAVINPRPKPLSAVLARPKHEPEYISVGAKAAGTFRDRAPGQGAVVVLPNPFVRLQDRWGRSADGESVAYVLRAGRDPALRLTEAHAFDP